MFLKILTTPSEWERQLTFCVYLGSLWFKIRTEKRKCETVQYSNSTASGQGVAEGLDSSRTVVCGKRNKGEWGRAGLVFKFYMRIQGENLELVEDM